jgi:hypothetical protein
MAKAGDVAFVLMTLRDQIKVYHWQTITYSRHIATNDLVTKLDANIDQFVEVYIGRYGRPMFSGKTSRIPLKNINDAGAVDILKQAITWMTEQLPTYLKKTDTDLFNIRDTIVGDLNQVLYLFTFTK